MKLIRKRPLIYINDLNINYKWINSLVKDFKEQGVSNIIPSIQVKECYREERFTEDEFRKCIDEALKAPSQGIIFWSWDYLIQEAEKEKVMKEEVIETTGKVLIALPGGTFKVEIENGSEIICHVSGKIRKNYINILPGDSVMVTISKYDLTKGRITFRMKG